MQNTICVDFDGVIHWFTSPWTAPDVIPDGPVPGAFAALKEYLDAGFQVVIFSARLNTVDPETGQERKSGLMAMHHWFAKHGAANLLPRLTFNCHKPPAVLYIDDRGFCFTGTFPSLEMVQNFRPWNKV